jgi:hypothetical protein
VKGGTGGTQTNEQGAFSISAPGTATLVFSSVGYGTQEIPVNNRTAIDVRLQADASNMDEVVVIG